MHDHRFSASNFHHQMSATLIKIANFAKHFFEIGKVPLKQLKILKRFGSYHNTSTTCGKLTLCHENIFEEKSSFLLHKKYLYISLVWTKHKPAKLTKPDTSKAPIVPCEVTEATATFEIRDVYHSSFLGGPE